MAKCGRCVIPLSEADEEALPAIITMLVEMEIAEPLTELEAFYLRRTCKRAPGRPEPTAFYRELSTQRKSVDLFPGRGTTNLSTQVAMVAASWEDRKSFGIAMDRWHLGRLADLLDERGLADFGPRFRQAVERVGGAIFLRIRNLSNDTGLSVKQTAVPRLRVTPTAPNMETLIVPIEITCEECGAVDIDFPDGEDPQGPAVCEGCGHVFGTRAAVFDLAHYAANLVGIKTLR